MISQDTIDEVKERASIVEIVSESLQLKRQGSSFVGLCPFHSEKTPSFHVRERDNGYHCFGCGESGNVIMFVMKEKGYSYPEAIEYLAQRFGIVVRREGGGKPRAQSSLKKDLAKLNLHAQEFFRGALQSCPDAVKSYLIDRKLTPQAVESFKVGFCPVARGGGDLLGYLRGKGAKDDLLLISGLARRSMHGEIYSAYAGRLIFPIISEGKEILGFGGRIIPALFPAERAQTAPKYINSPENDLYHKSKTLFGLPQALEAIRRTNEAYFVEGYMDVIGLWQAGLKNVVASCGTALTDGHLKRLSRLASKLFVLFDGDSAGRAAAAKSFLVFNNAEIDGQAVFLPDGEDPDSFAAKHGEDTQRQISLFKPHSLVDCYLNSLVAKANCSEMKELGGAAAEKIAAELARAIARTERPLQRDRQIEQVWFRFQMDKQRLYEMVEQARSGASTKAPEEQAAEEVPQISMKPVSELPRLDREILLAVMAHRDELVTKVLADPEISTSLDSASMAFVHGLQTAIAVPDPAKAKERVKELLRSLHGSWGQLWTQAHAMQQEKGSDLRRTFAECTVALRKIRLNQRVKEVDRRIAASSDDEEKIRLYQEKLTLEKQARSAGDGLPR